jgi:phage terminase large subunit-like protein
VTDIAPWPPTRYTEPLRPDFESLFDRFEPVLRIAWRRARGYELEAWQVALLRAITELTDAGRLRFRTVLVSLARQSGKSEIVAALGLLFLLWKASPYVVGIASNREQAELVYKRAMDVILNNPALRKRFDRITGTRGISTNTGGVWELKPAKSAALQGIPVDLGVVDEVHLVKPDLWTDLVNGLGGRADCMVVGITTAGDSASELLLSLYDLESPSFGKFIWEAPEARIPEDDETLAEYIKAANPAVASGRIDAAVYVEDVRAEERKGKREAKAAIRYRLNRFVDGAGADAFISPGDWAALAEPSAAPAGVLYFGIDAPQGLTACTIAGAWKDADGITHTSVVVSWTRPSLSRIGDAAVDLYSRFGPAAFVTDSRNGRSITEELKRRGLPVIVAGYGDVLAGDAMLYSKVVHREIRHTNDEPMLHQMLTAQRVTKGDAWRVVARRGTPWGIDAIRATGNAVWATETQQEPTLGVL